VAGGGVQLLERIEPALVKYTTPLLDMILKVPDLDPDLRKFFTQLKTPTDEAGAIILSGLASTTGGAVASSILGAVLAKPTQGFLRMIRPTLMDISSLMTAERRMGRNPAYANDLMQLMGYPDADIAAFREISKLRAGFADWIEGNVRGNVWDTALETERVAQGVTPEVAKLLMDNRVNLVQFDDLRQAMYRLNKDTPWMIAQMAKLGWKSAETLLLLDANKPLPPLSDVIRLAVREAWRDDVAAKWGYDQDYPSQVGDIIGKLGFDPDWGKRYWRAHWELPSLTYAIEMTHRGIISPDEFKEMLRIADYPAGWRDRMLKAIYSPLTRVDVRRMYGLGVLGPDDVKKSYKDLGYDDLNAERMKEFTIKYEDEKGESKPEKYREITLGLTQQAYLKGLIGPEEFLRRVVELRYPDDEAALLLRITDARKTVEKTPDYSTEYRRDVKAFVERAFYKGSIDAETARSYLTEAGLGSEEIAYSLAANDLARAQSTIETELKSIGDAYQSRAITRTEAVALLGKLDVTATEQERVLYDWETPMLLRNRRLTESQYRKAWGQTFIGEEEYKEAMRGLGYSEGDIDLLVKMGTPQEGE